jgi:uncharacterized membrane protein YhaH (DUF805 family)
MPPEDKGMTAVTFLWGYAGRLRRRDYALAGLALFVLKFLIDHSLARFLFHRDWSLVDYLAPGQAIGALLSDVPDRRFFLTMALFALPFIAAGACLTVRRLRDAALPPALVFLFFIPFINLLFFALLATLPSRRDTDAAPASPVPIAAPAAPIPLPLEYGHDPHRPWWLSRLWPANDTVSAALAIFLPVPILLALVLFATHVLRQYGWGLFLGLPFINGLLAAVFHGLRVPRRLRQSLGVGALAVTVTAAATFTFAVEGLGCLIMFLPLAWPIGIIGAALGHAIQARRADPRLRAATAWRVGCSATVLLPLMMSAERAVDATAPLLHVTTAVEVHAPPDVVWSHVVSFPELPPPREWVFRTGVAYPVRARIDGAGPGACRYCEFSTGPFVEPIETWDAPRLLRFAVTDNPPPMTEWTPWPNVHPPHLDHFLVSHAGQFRLTPLPGGRTRLEGTTWYRHHMWPAAYWRLWSDFIIHRIHLRVLNHVKALSESDPAPYNPPDP